MKILTDFHHSGLLQSLILLFEKRLGYDLYRPIGLDWYGQGFWNIYPHIDTAKQYLSLDQGYLPVDGTPPLNQIAEIGNGIYLCKDIAGETPNKAITLERFKQEKFDILIASIPQHIEPFKKLISLYQPQAKLIYQIGNQWNIDPNSVKNVLSSAKVDIPPGINGVVYHQEFDLDTFHYEPAKPTKKIYSFINCLGTADIFKKDWELFLALEKLLPDWEFKSFGGQCRDGSINNTKELAGKMREATFIFHCKSGGDGYGHIIHNAAAMGRPLITRFEDYEGKLAEPLLQGTSILVDGLTVGEIGKAIEEITDGMNEPVRSGAKIYQAFKENVDFDAEEQKIRIFLDNLQ